jgi:hypothetical protein
MILLSKSNNIHRTPVACYTNNTYPKQITRNTTLEKPRSTTHGLPYSVELAAIIHVHVHSIHQQRVKLHAKAGVRYFQAKEPSLVMQ